MEPMKTFGDVYKELTLNQREDLEEIIKSARKIYKLGLTEEQSEFCAWVLTEMLFKGSIGGEKK